MTEAGGGIGLAREAGREPVTQRRGERDADTLIQAARNVVRMEAGALDELAERIDRSIYQAVRTIAEASGRVIVSGIGKSGIIGRKIASTLTSTGTPATFLHPVEGLHGDLGIVGRDDTAILISKSGESEELTGLVEYLSRLGVTIIVMTGEHDSSLARAAQIVLDCSVREEACPLDLAPTTSTTTTLALGDALAVALLLWNGFSREDFARFHPGGALGRRLTLRVRDVMLTDDLPTLPPEATMRECVVLLAERRGTVPILDDDSGVVGVVTAGDLTRLMEQEENFFSLQVSRIMTRQPKVIEPHALAASAVFQMEEHGIMALPVIDEERRLIGIVHLHDLLKAGAA